MLVNSNNIRIMLLIVEGMILVKKNEAIYIINNRVIKFFEDKKVVNQRYKKSKIVKGIFPILKKINNFYYYNFEKGKTLYEVKKQTKIFNDFLKWADKNLWIKKKRQRI